MIFKNINTVFSLSFSFFSFFLFFLRFYQIQYALLDVLIRFFSWIVLNVLVQQVSVEIEQ